MSLVQESRLGAVSPPPQTSSTFERALWNLVKSKFSEQNGMGHKSIRANRIWCIGNPSIMETELGFYIHRCVLQKESCTKMKRKVKHRITMFSSYQPICNICIIHALCVYYWIWQLTYLIQEGPGPDVYYYCWPTRAGWKNTTETVPFQPRCTGILWNIYYRLDLIVQLDPTNEIVSFPLVLVEYDLDDLILVHFCTLPHLLDGEIQIHPNVEVYLCVVFESAQSRYD